MDFILLDTRGKSNRKSYKCQISNYKY